MFEKIRSELSLWKEMFGASMVAFSFKKWEEEIDAAEKEIEKLKTENMACVVSQAQFDRMEMLANTFQANLYDAQKENQQLRKELAEAKYKRRVQCFRVDFGADDFNVTAL
jgi:predicted RNase H-like nuclease (RuvC/YqgF family)